jgi:hypothetical protein
LVAVGVEGVVLAVLWLLTVLVVEEMVVFVLVQRLNANGKQFCLHEEAAAAMEYVYGHLHKLNMDGQKQEIKPQDLIGTISRKK